MAEGQRLAGRYQLVEPIGRGGMGIVWRAHDELLDRLVAIKEVRHGWHDETERADFTRRTVREARAAGRLSHPNVVVVHDVIEEDGRPWIVMQLVRARSLGDVLYEQGPMVPERVAAIGLQILDALCAAHDSGILHRDVKPENVLITPDHRVVLTDFGIAMMVEEPGMTMTGIVTGTPAFISPERLSGHPATPESDLWSLGATLYAAVEGQSPFERGTPIASMAAALNGVPEPMRHAGALAPVIQGLLARNPAQRMKAVEAAALLRAVTQPPSDMWPQGYARPGSPPGQPPESHSGPRTDPRAGVPGPGVRAGNQGWSEAAPPPNPQPAANNHGWANAAPPPNPQPAANNHGWANAAPPPSSTPTGANHHEWADAAPPTGAGNHGWVDAASPPMTQTGANNPAWANAAPPPNGPLAVGSAWTTSGGRSHDSSPRTSPAEHSGWPSDPVNLAPSRHPDAGPDLRPASGPRTNPLTSALTGRALILIVAPLVILLVAAGAWFGYASLTDTGAGDAATAEVTSRADSTSTDPTPEPTTPRPTPSPELDGATVSSIPDGWSEHRDPLGFSIALPPGWTAYAREKTRVKFHGPGSDGYLQIDLTPWESPDPVLALTTVEANSTRKGYLPGYQRIRLDPGYFTNDHLQVTSAEWEFSFSPERGEQHVIDTAFRARDRYIALYWQVPASEWAKGATLYGGFISTFDPN